MYNYFVSSALNFEIRGYYIGIFWNEKNGRLYKITNHYSKSKLTDAYVAKNIIKIEFIIVLYHITNISGIFHEDLVEKPGKDAS